MKFLLAALPALVVAQYGAPPDPAAAASSASPSSSASAAAASPASPSTHTVQVGGPTLIFSPNVTTAAVNETVTFVFTNTLGTVMHSVTQSTFASPCELAPGGFSSGFQTTNFSFTITITDATKPIWFFCSQIAPAPHCNKDMVGAINPPTTGNTFANFAASALNATDVAASSTVLSGLGAAATAPAAAVSVAAGSGSGSAAAPTSSSPSSAGKLIAGAGSLLAGMFAAVYTLV